MSYKYSFDNFIIKCCKMDEWDLRSFLKDKLTEVGFNIQEDDYRPGRGGKYSTVHNMLATRGNDPKVCLVAHTDVCRDHGSRLERQLKTDPVIKDRNGRNIIQDRHCSVQVGGDDRLGVAINAWIALNTGYDMGLLFTTDEEIGGGSADAVDFSELREFELLAQVDRGNYRNQLVTSIGGTQLCDKITSHRLLSLASDIGMPRESVSGFFTDVAEIKRAGKCRNAVNMTCGYFQSHSSSEYIDIEDARDTMEFVSEIIKDYSVEENEKFYRSEMELQNQFGEINAI